MQTAQQFAEVFDHVVTLGFAVYQYVQVQFFLLFNHQGDFFFSSRLRNRRQTVRLFYGCACLADFGSLWKEPMLVVGSRGKFNHACCALIRSANGDLRWSALAGKSARRLATSARWISLLLARESAAAWLAASSSATESRPSFNAASERAILGFFCRVNANQEYRSGLLAFSFLQLTSQMECAAESKSWRSTNGRPVWLGRGSTVSKTLFRLARQMLRPSITPADRTLS